jgi:hypothetical protein
MCDMVGEMTEELEIPLSYNMMGSDTSLSFAAFTVYRDLGPDRSISKVAKLLEKSDALIRRWSAENQWVERSKLYDAEIDKRTVRQDLFDKEAAAIRHIRLARKIQNLADDQLSKHVAMAKDISDAHIDAEKAAKMAKEAVLMERLVHGDPTEHTQNSGDIDLSKLDTDELLLLKALMAKARKGE